MKLRPAASWRILTCAGPGSATSASSHSRTSGPPVLWSRIAWLIARLQAILAAKGKPEGFLPCIYRGGDQNAGLVARPRRQRREKQQRNDVGDLDHRIDGGAGGILVGIADRVARHRRLVRLRTLAAVIAVLDILLGIVPRAAARG